MVKRETYLSKLRELKDVQIIKVITGVRRCGKSTLLEQFKNELLSAGVLAKNTQSYNMEEPKNAEHEIDFAAKDTAGYLHYYQVCLTMRDEATRERELSAFDKLKNHHPKIVITLDPEEPTYNGIVQRNATKWLLNK